MLCKVPREECRRAVSLSVSLSLVGPGASASLAARRIAARPASAPTAARVPRA